MSRAAMTRAGEAAAIQRQALGPEASVWVSASAGTGKTKVLTDRLLALMLDGTDPARILCLTFTRAAAAEMANRVNARLAAWATLPPGQLDEELAALIGRMPDAYETTLARQLFARVLDSPGSAKIATIHAFCQSLLRRFPLEAGVPPEFAVLDERGAAEALAEAAETVIAKARDNRAPALAEALAVVARYIQEDRFTGLLTAMTAERGKLRAALGAGEVALRTRLATVFAVPEDITPDYVARQALLVEQPSSAAYLLVLGWLAGQTSLRPPMPLGTIEALKSAVASSLGMAIVPEVAVAMHMSDFIVRPLQPPLTRTLALIEHRNKPNEPALEIVRNALLALRSDEAIAPKAGNKAGKSPRAKSGRRDRAASTRQ